MWHYFAFLNLILSVMQGSIIFSLLPQGHFLKLLELVSVRNHWLKLKNHNSNSDVSLWFGGSPVAWGYQKWAWANWFLKLVVQLGYQNFLSRLNINCHENFFSTSIISLDYLKYDPGYQDWQWPDWSTRDFFLNHRLDVYQDRPRINITRLIDHGLHLTLDHWHEP